jgi:D-glycero-D-manno-heptose 1,7-bisphosphate phosphatase
MGRDKPGSRRAVFLDRDGVINRNVWNPTTSQYESPLTAEAFELLPGVIHALLGLQSAGFLLFVVSNQPNYSKGKSSIDTPAAIHRKLLALTTQAGIIFAGCYYCFHHPEGSESGYAGPCVCRKPSPYFLLHAQEYFGIDLTASWMIGDRESDVQCGKAAGTRTILIQDAPQTPRSTIADESASQLADATQWILDPSNAIR